MANGLTRTEQYALIGVIGLIALGMAIHGLRGADEGEVSVTHGQGMEKLGEVGADGHSTIKTESLNPAETTPDKID